jgi:catechol 2,3-dioxygenase-like lactoylglutathione lyase family enzyme
MKAVLSSTRDVIVRAPDLEAARKFYQDVLGFAPTLDRPGLIGFETGAFQLFVEQGEPAHAPVFEMRVADLASAKKALLAAGCTVIEENPAIPRCYLRDPLGVVFNLDVA